jgi:(3,5-dihydroxyphenyl)acetyl-CoA 1,2-dioxygenase
MNRIAPSEIDRVRASGLGESAVAEWQADAVDVTGDYNADAARFATFWGRSNDLLRRLPPKPKRSDAEAAAAVRLLAAAREHRERFLTCHVGRVYDKITRERTRFVRLDALVLEAAASVPGLVPTQVELAAESALAQRDKEGIEIDHGIFLAHVLRDKTAGRHLCHAMLLPRLEAAQLLPKLAVEGAVDLGKVSIERKGKASLVTLRNPRYLNAEDETTFEAMETAVELAILDPATEIGVLRGGQVEHPKYRGRRVFGSGINLTHLYRGYISFVGILQRDLGFVHKLLRGVARVDALPDDVHGHGAEKPWIAVVDGFAIGGHCQILLTMDYVLAADDAYMTLPASKEGIIPGFANLRLPRFTGDRIARQVIQNGRKLICDAADGRLICDEIARHNNMDTALDRAIERLSSAGPLAAVSNRRALRAAQEPLDLFRRYASAYARDQAYCCFSAALIANLERNWDAQNRNA